MINESRAIIESLAIQLYLAEKYPQASCNLGGRWRREPRCTAGGTREFRQGPASRFSDSVGR
ncbi:hypothetical protein [Halomonas sp. KG2]|uniref:hypothetical protein n=1 Tax=Halomonas sp. KG2 TaxID=2951138 RepID=UPI00406CB73F